MEQTPHKDRASRLRSNSLIETIIDKNGKWEDAFVKYYAQKGAYERARVRRVSFTSKEVHRVSEFSEQSPEQLLAHDLGLDLQKCSLKALKALTEGVSSRMIDILEVQRTEGRGQFKALRKRKLCIEIQASGKQLLLTHVSPAASSSSSALTPTVESGLHWPHSMILRHAPQHVLSDIGVDQEPKDAAPQFIQDLFSLSPEQFDACFHIDTLGIKIKSTCIEDQMNVELPGLMTTIQVTVVPVKAKKPTLLPFLGLPQGAPFALQGGLLGHTLWNWRHMHIAPMLQGNDIKYLLANRMSSERSERNQKNDDDEDALGEDDEEPALEWLCQDVLRNRKYDVRWLCHPKFKADSMLVLLADSQDEVLCMPILLEIHFGRGDGVKAAEAQNIRDTLGASAAKVVSDVMYQSSSLHDSVGNGTFQQVSEKAGEWCAVQLSLPGCPWGQDCRTGETSICTLRNLMHIAYDYETRIFIGVEKTTSTTGAMVAQRSHLAQEALHLLNVVVGAKGPLIALMDVANVRTGSESSHGQGHCPKQSGEILSASFADMAEQLRKDDPLPRQVCELLPGVAASATKETPTEQLIACLLELERAQTKVKHKAWYRTTPWSTRCCLTHGCLHTGHMLVGGLRQLWVTGMNSYHEISMNALQDLVALSTSVLLEDLQLPTVVKDLPALVSASEYSAVALADWFEIDEDDASRYLSCRARKSSLQMTANFWDKYHRGSTTITNVTRASGASGTFEQWRFGSVSHDSAIDNRLGSRASIKAPIERSSTGPFPKVSAKTDKSGSLANVKSPMDRSGTTGETDASKETASSASQCPKVQGQESRRASQGRRRSSIVPAKLPKRASQAGSRSSCTPARSSTSQQGSGHNSQASHSRSSMTSKRASKRSSTRVSLTGGVEWDVPSEAMDEVEKEDERANLKLLGPRHQSLTLPMRSWAKEFYAEAVILSEEFAKRLPYALAGQGLGPPPEDLRTNPMRFAWELQEPLIALAADRLNTNGGVFSVASDKVDQRGAARRTAAAMVPMIVAAVSLAQESRVPPWQRFWILTHATCLAKALTEVLANLVNLERGSVASLPIFEDGDANDESQVGPQTKQIKFAQGHRLWLISPKSEEIGSKPLVRAIVKRFTHRLDLDDGTEQNLQEARPILGLPCGNRGLSFGENSALFKQADTRGLSERPAAIRKRVFRSNAELIKEEIYMTGRVLEAVDLTSSNVDVWPNLNVDRDFSVRFDFRCGSTLGEGFATMKSQVNSRRILALSALQDLLASQNDWIDENVRHSFSYASDDGSSTFFGDGVDSARKELYKLCQSARQAGALATPASTGKVLPPRILPNRRRMSMSVAAIAAAEAAAATEVRANQYSERNRNRVLPGTLFYMTYRADILVEPVFVEGSFPEDCSKEIFFAGQTIICEPEGLAARKAAEKQKEPIEDSPSSPKSPRSPKSASRFVMAPPAPSDSPKSASRFITAPPAASDSGDDSPPESPRSDPDSPLSKLNPWAQERILAMRQEVSMRQNARRNAFQKGSKKAKELTAADITLARMKATGYPHEEQKAVLMARISFTLRASPVVDLLPHGTRIRLLDGHHAAGCAATIGQMQKSGEYELRVDGGGSTVFFDPDRAAGNFEPAGVYRYQEAQALVVYYGGEWVDATVLETLHGNLHKMQVTCQEQQKTVHVDLNEVNHTPAWLTISEFDCAAQRYGSTIRASCGFVADPVSGRSLDILKMPFTVTYAESQPGNDNALPHLMSILDPPSQRKLGLLEGWGVVVYGGLGKGKTTLAKRLAVACVYSLGGYLPIMVNLQEILRVLQEPDPLDALLWARHGGIPESLETFWLLKQAQCCRRSLIIVDGADANGQGWFQLLTFVRRMIGLGHRVAIFAQSLHLDPMQNKQELRKTASSPRAKIALAPDRPKSAGPAGPRAASPSADRPSSARRDRPGSARRRGSAVMPGPHSSPGTQAPLLELELRLLTLKAQQEGAAARLGDKAARSLKDFLGAAGDVTKHPFGLTLLLSYIEAKNAKGEYRVRSNFEFFDNTDREEAQKHRWSLTEALHGATDMCLHHNLNYPLAVGVAQKPSNVKDCGQMLEVLALELQREGCDEIGLTDVDEHLRHERDELPLRVAWQDLCNAVASNQFKLLQFVQGSPEGRKTKGHTSCKTSVRFMTFSLREYFAARCCVRLMQENRPTGLPSIEQMIFAASWAIFLQFQYELLEKYAVPVTLDFTAFDMDARCMELLVEFFEQRCLRSLSLRLALHGHEVAKPGSLPRLLAGAGSVLTRLSIRCCALGVEGMTVLSNAIAEQHIAPSHVDLRHCSVGHNGMKVFSEVLAKDDKIIYLNLAGNIMGSGGAVHMATALQTNEVLQHLELENNSFASLGAEALVASTKGRNQLQHLGIAGNRIGDDGSKHLVELMRGQWCLRELNIGANAINGLGIQRLAQGLTANAKLEKLSLNGNEIGPEGMYHFSAALQLLYGASALRRLDLEYTMLCTEGAAFLASALRDGAGLESLELRGNRLGSQGVAHLADALCILQFRKTNKLRRLGLRSNACHEEGARALASVLRDEHGVLEDLDISDNRIGDAGAGAISEALREERGAAGRYLTKLALNSNVVGSAGGEALAKALSDRQVPAVLQCLELSGNTVGDVGALAVCRALLKSPALTEIKLERNRISSKGAAALAVLVVEMKSITKIGLNGNFIGKQLLPYVEDLCLLRLRKPRNGEEQVDAEDFEMQWVDDVRADIRKRLDELGMPKQPSDSFKRAAKIASLLEGIVKDGSFAPKASKKPTLPPEKPKPDPAPKPKRPGMCYPGWRAAQAAEEAAQAAKEAAQAAKEAAQAAGD